MSEAKYSQPLPETPRDVAGPIVKAGFVGKGRNKRPGFVFVDPKGKLVHAEITRANVANEKPTGFFRSLARLWASGGKP